MIAMSHKKENYKRPLVLGVETSCDETAAAIVASDKTILANRVLSQIEEHRPYGGVVPEIAARSHIDHLPRLIEEALQDAGLAIEDIDAIAATTGPGLIGGLLVGVTMAKAMAFAAEKPFLAINHLEGHALSARLTDDLDFPYLLLLVSGGHCQLLAVSKPGRYKRLGTTIDDAIGEAFDKAAKLLGLGYPGGPAIEKAAKEGEAARFPLPRPLLGTAHCNFSFSGLKTALMRSFEKTGPDDIPHLAAAFQAAIGDCLVDRTERAMTAYEASKEDMATHRTLVVAGGVAANEYLRSRLRELCEEKEYTLSVPPGWLCADNAAMIAWAGVERLRTGFPSDPDSAPRARWPLDESSRPVYGSGRKGAKA